MGFPPTAICTPPTPTGHSQCPAVLPPPDAASWYWIWARPEVVDHLYQVMSHLLCDNDISYIKWDMNRNLTDVFSRALPASRQGEAAHRYLLGLYTLLDRLTTEFPDVLFEGCAGGGGRFDAGMLYYFPQSWCSDDTDPIHRLKIQYGTSFGYPPAAMGSHVSASPNHQSGPQHAAGHPGHCGHERDLRLRAGPADPVR